VIGASDHEDTVVVLQPINLIKEVTPDIVRHDSVEILEDEVARRELAGLAEDLLDGIFRTSPLF
jgi:hypothetical protein